MHLIRQEESIEYINAAIFWDNTCLQNLFTSTCLLEVNKWRPPVTPGCHERFTFYVFGIWWHLPDLWGSREKPLSSASVGPCLSLALASRVTLISLSVLRTPLAVTLPWLAYLSQDTQFPKPSLIPQRSMELNSPTFDVSFLLCFCPDKSQSHSSWGNWGPYFPLCPSLYYSFLTLAYLQGPVFCLLSSTKGTSSISELQRSYLPAKLRCPLSLGKSTGIIS